jgi:heme-degrading monooxygenase HmoA
MATFVEMDERVPLAAQMEETLGPVVLVNTFTVESDEVAPLLKAWAADAAWMKQQPGFISTQLHRGIGGSRVFLNYAVWESSEHFKRAFQPSRVPIAPWALPGQHPRVAAPVPEAGDAGHLRVLAEGLLANPAVSASRRPPRSRRS